MLGSKLAVGVNGCLPLCVGRGWTGKMSGIPHVGSWGRLCVMAPKLFSLFCGMPVHTLRTHACTRLLTLNTQFLPPQADLCVSNFLT